MREAEEALVALRDADPLNRSMVALCETALAKLRTSPASETAGQTWKVERARKNLIHVNFPGHAFISLGPDDDGWEMFVGFLGSAQSVELRVEVVKP